MSDNKLQMALVKRQSRKIKKRQAKCKKLWKATGSQGFASLFPSFFSTLSDWPIRVISTPDELLPSLYVELTKSLQQLWSSSDAAIDTTLTTARVNWHHRTTVHFKPTKILLRDF